MNAMVFTSEEEYEQAIQDEIKLLNNFKAHISQTRETNKQQKNDDLDMSGLISQTQHANMLTFDQFELRDQLKILDNKFQLNPQYYDKHVDAFDLRVTANKPLGENSKIIKSTYWNQRTNTMLMKSSSEKR